MNFMFPSILRDKHFHELFFCQGPFKGFGAKEAEPTGYGWLLCPLGKNARHRKRLCFLFAQLPPPPDDSCCGPLPVREKAVS